MRSRSPGHSWPGLAVLVCWGAAWTPAPRLAPVSHPPQQGEGVGGREARLCVSGETVSQVVAVVVRLDLGAG